MAVRLYLMYNIIITITILMAHPQLFSPIVCTSRILSLHSLSVNVLKPYCILVNWRKTWIKKNLSCTLHIHSFLPRSVNDFLVNASVDSFSHTYGLPCDIGQIKQSSWASLTPSSKCPSTNCECFHRNKL